MWSALRIPLGGASVILHTSGAEPSHTENTCVPEAGFLLTAGAGLSPLVRCAYLKILLARRLLRRCHPLRWHQNKLRRYGCKAAKHADLLAAMQGAGMAAATSLMMVLAAAGAAVC